jgi:hypothetical protein
MSKKTHCEEPDDLQEHTISTLVETIFNEPPKDPSSIPLIRVDEADHEYVFEILLNVLMEAFCHFMPSFDDVDWDDFSVNHITIMNPWFKSLGFEIMVDEVPTSDYMEHLSKGLECHYCRTIINTGDDGRIFTMKNIKSKFHFLLNSMTRTPEYQSGCTKLDDYYTIFEAGSSTFKIRFKLHNPASDSSFKTGGMKPSSYPL